MPNGLTSTLPWPKPSSVRSVRLTVGGTDPVTVGDAVDDVVGADAVLRGGRGQTRAAASCSPARRRWCCTSWRTPATSAPCRGRIRRSWGSCAARCRCARAAEQRVGRGHVAVDRRARGDDLERRPRRDTGPWWPAGPSASAAAFCATARISPVDGLIATIMAFLPTMSTASCAAFWTERSRLIVTEGAGAPGSFVEHVDVAAVLVDADDAPARLAVELVDDRLLDLVDDGGREAVVGGQQVGLRGDDHAGQAADRGRHRVAVGLAQRDQVQRLGRRARRLGEPLRRPCVGSNRRRVSATVVAVGIRSPPAGLRVERVVVQVAGPQHVGAADAR